MAPIRNSERFTNVLPLQAVEPQQKVLDDVIRGRAKREQYVVALNYLKRSHYTKVPLKRIVAVANGIVGCEKRQENPKYHEIAEAYLAARAQIAIAETQDHPDIVIAKTLINPGDVYPRRMPGAILDSLKTISRMHAGFDEEYRVRTFTLLSTLVETIRQERNIHIRDSDLKKQWTYKAGAVLSNLNIQVGEYDRAYEISREYDSPDLKTDVFHRARILAKILPRIKTYPELDRYMEHAYELIRMANQLLSGIEGVTVADNIRITIAKALLKHDTSSEYFDPIRRAVNLVIDLDALKKGTRGGTLVGSVFEAKAEFAEKAIEFMKRNSFPFLDRLTEYKPKGKIRSPEPKDDLLETFYKDIASMLALGHIKFERRVIDSIFTNKVSNEEKINFLMQIVNTTVWKRDNTDSGIGPFEVDCLNGLINDPRVINLFGGADKYYSDPAYLALFAKITS